MPEAYRQENPLQSAFLAGVNQKYPGVLTMFDTTISHAVSADGELVFTRKPDDRTVICSSAKTAAVRCDS